jgi:hypothetical protein
LGPTFPGFAARFPSPSVEFDDFGQNSEKWKVKIKKFAAKFAAAGKFAVSLKAGF